MPELPHHTLFFDEDLALTVDHRCDVTPLVRDEQLQDRRQRTDAVADDVEQVLDALAAVRRDRERPFVAAQQRIETEFVPF